MWGKSILFALAVFANFGGVGCLGSGESWLAIVKFRYCPAGLDVAEQVGPHERSNFSKDQD